MLIQIREPQEDVLLRISEAFTALAYHTYVLAGKGELCSEFPKRIFKYTYSVQSVQDKGEDTVVDNQFIASNDFLKTYEWRKARQQVLDKYDSRCMCCGTKPTEDKYLCVDHIKPRKTNPELALDVSNLQILCNECNHGKGNWSVKDWRGNGTFIITEQWLNDNCTIKGGYTKEQFKVIGASNKTGWKKRLAGTKITEDQRVAFEESKFITSGSKRKLASTKDNDFVKESIASANNLNEWQVEVALLRAELEAMKVEMKKLTKVVKAKITKAS